MTDKDYYTLLGVEENADTQQIKDAYRQKAFEFHPDRNPGNVSAADQMKAINEAYAVLSNPEKRQQYDLLRRNYGGGAYDHFRRSYSEQDIFKNSDLQQVFEEIARSFGLRGFDDVFRDFYGQNYKKFEFYRPGIFAKGFVFKAGGRRRPGRPFASSGVLGFIANKVIQNLAGVQFGSKGKDIHDVIDLQPEFAVSGGAYAYFLRAQNKKLVVKIPANVREGQRIRLSGMGQPGRSGGENGDLYLKVRIHVPMVEKIRKLIGIKKR